MGEVICYRIVEIKNGNAMSLFHGTNGSRVLPVGRWVRADRKVVSDGSCATKYESGFHVFKSIQEACTFFGKMFKIKENRVIVACEATGLRPKSHARGEVYLANRLRILSLDPVSA